MAAFSLDSVFSPNSPLKNSGFLDEFFPNWTQLYPSNPIPNNLEGSSMDASNQESSCIEQQSFNSMAEKRSFSRSTSMADKAESGEQVTQICLKDDKKRKSRNGSSSNSGNSKDVKQARGKKQKGDKEAKKEERNEKKDEKKAKNEEEPPKGYIHVRARRGQATDSHSLAERVRREKISERMKMLQALVPGCDKVTGKALMLDEIINYVQSLQNQVEFLSMRLASLDPMVYNFGLMDLDPMMPFGAQGVINHNGMALSMPPMSMSSSPAAVAATNNISSAPSTIFSDVKSAIATIPNACVTQPSNIFDSNALTTTSTTAATTTTTGVGLNQPIDLPNANPMSTTMATTTFASPNVIDGSTNLFQIEQKPSLLLPQERSVYLGSGVDDQQRLSFFNQFGFGANNWYYD